MYITKLCTIFFLFFPFILGVFYLVLCIIFTFFFLTRFPHLCMLFSARFTHFCASIFLTSFLARIWIYFWHDSNLFFLHVSYVFSFIPDMGNGGDIKNIVDRSSMFRIILSIVQFSFTRVCCTSFRVDCFAIFSPWFFFSRFEVTRETA